MFVCCCRLCVVCCSVDVCGSLCVVGCLLYVI